jgi:hypothetical protein
MTKLCRRGNDCFNIRANTQAVNFTNYILKLCDLGSLNGISLPLESLHNVGTYLKNRLFTYFTHFWKDQIEQSRYSCKLRTLVQVKNNFVFEEYLHEICNVKHRQAITKMRISAHKLPIESGRYTKTPYEDLFCTLCQSNEIGDEFHYLLSCSNQKISETRNIFLNDLYGINSSFRLFGTNNLLLYSIF